MSNVAHSPLTARHMNQMHQVEEYYTPVELVLHRHANSLHRLMAEREAIETRREDFVEEFLTYCRSQWLHVFEKAKNSLREFGHHADVEFGDERFQECIMMEITPYIGPHPKPRINGLIKLFANEATCEAVLRFVAPDGIGHPAADVHFKMSDLTEDRLEAEIARGIEVILEHSMPKRASTE